MPIARVAALYDIHGNLPALTAVLREVKDTAVDHIVIGGDVLPGPMPRETIAALARLDVPTSFIRGNGEVAVLHRMTGEEPTLVPATYRPMIQWVADQLDSDHKRMMSAWPLTLTLDIDGLGTVLFCHATPRNENEIFTRATPADRLLPVFADVDATLVVCGHTHMQFDRRVGSTRIVNAGSVGMPFEQPGGAYWLLLGSDVQLRRTEYDRTAAAERIRETSFPQVEELAVRCVLNPPSEDETLKLFTPAELRA